MPITDWITFGSTIVTGLGVGVSIIALWLQLKKLNDQLMLQHFADYTKRYQEIFQRFPEEIHDPGFDLHGWQDYNSIMRVLRAYFDLCFEQWYLHTQRMIDDRIWKIWEGGMKTAFSKLALQQAWLIVSRDTPFGKGFEDYVSSLITEAQSTQHFSATIPSLAGPVVVLDRPSSVQNSGTEEA